MMDGVTFDFWNTLMWEEPGSLKEKRLEVWVDVLTTIGVPVDAVRLNAAHDAAHQEYVASWTAGRQFRVEEAVDQMVGHLDGDFGPEVKQVLLDGFGEAGRRAAMHVSCGARECLEALARAGVRIGIICDIGLTPSPVLCELLDHHDLRRFFDSMSFSDEVGHYKPSRAIFEHALAGLGGIPPQRAAHVGDRRRTDVRGAIAMGMTAIRYKGVYDDETVPAPEPEIVLADLAEIPRVLGVAD